jgi:signal transduction histidine kinase
MARPGLRIHYKIVVPLVLLFIAAAAVTAFVSLRLMTGTLKAGKRLQIERASAMIAQTDFALNRSVMQRLTSIVAADIVTFGADGRALATTIDEGTGQELLTLIRGRMPPAGDLVRDAAVIAHFDHRGTPYTVAYRPVAGVPGAVMALATSDADIAGVERSMRRTILYTAVLIVVLLSLAGQFVVRTVTAPVLALVEFTRRVAERGLVGSAPVRSRDEIGLLADSFNDMMDKLRQSEEKLLRSEKLALAGLLAARVAHDVRNPLSSIKMRAQLLENRLKPGADGYELVQAILREIDRVEGVVKGLLELARPGELALETAAVNAVVEEALEQFAPQLRHRKIAIETHLDPALPPIRLDVDRFKLAVLNIVANAAEAMIDGGTLQVTTTHRPERAAIQIDVCDDGIGLDPAVRDRVFDPFVSTKREGVGLGLVNSRSVIEGHGGTIELSPREPKGTRARILLPGEPPVR